jgi:hypothetical protein
MNKSNDEVVSNNSNVDKPATDTLNNNDCVTYITNFMAGIAFVLASVSPVYFAIGCIQIYLGTFNDCSNNYLNMWSIINGCCYIVVGALILCDVIINKCSIGATYYYRCVEIIVLSIFALLQFGTRWFFTYDTGTNYSECSESLYKFGMFVIIFEWLYVGLLALILILTVFDTIRRR